MASTIPDFSTMAPNSSSWMQVPVTKPNPAGLAGSAATSAQTAGTATAGSQLPGYMTSMGNIGTNIASETAGQVPQDVIDQLKEQGAESNAVTGAASNAGYLKALGLTSLGLTQTGQQNLENILPSTPGYTVSQNPEFQTSAALSYEQQLQQQVFQRQQQQQQLEMQQQQAALAAAQGGLRAGGGGTTPVGAFPGIESGRGIERKRCVHERPDFAAPTVYGATSPWTAGTPAAAAPTYGGVNPWTGGPAAGATPAVPTNAWSGDTGPDTYGAMAGSLVGDVGGAGIGASIPDIGAGAYDDSGGY